MSRHLVWRFGSAVALVGLAVPAAHALASAPPTSAPPPPDTGFLRDQAETALLTENPGIGDVACVQPAADEPGVVFVCYGRLEDGSVLMRQAVVNDDGGIEFGEVGAATADATTTTAPAGYEGTGSQVVQVPTITAPTIVSITHDGTGAFSVQPQQAGAAIGQPIAAATGAVDGRYLVGLDGTVSAFAVTADGTWSLRSVPATNALPLAAGVPAASDGPDVVGYAATADVEVTFEYAGTAPYAVTSVTAGGRTELGDGTGPFTGPLTLPAGPGFVTVDAVGAWTLTVGPSGPSATAAG